MAAVRGVARSFAALARNRGYATLLVAEHNGKNLSKVTSHALAAATQLPGATSVDLLVLGDGCGDVAKEGAALAGVTTVLQADSKQFKNAMADTTVEFLQELQKSKDYKVVSGVSGSFCRDVLPRLAARLDVQPITDIIGVGSEDGVFERPMYAGNAVATVKSNDTIRLLTFRPTSFEAVAPAAQAAKIEVLAPQEYSAGIEWLNNEVRVSDKPQLSSASTVVSGGRALKSGENFDKVLEPLCDKLKAAMGASRAAVDAGFVPNELQVGQTGKVVAPDLYVAVGISGAIQHLSGMKDSKTIVAINKDPDAPIFQVADYGLVADLFEAVPEMTGKL